MVGEANWYKVDHTYLDLELLWCFHRNFDVAATISANSFQADVCSPSLLDRFWSQSAMLDLEA